MPPTPAPRPLHPAALKARLARGEFLASATLTVPSVEIAAQVAALGFDFLWIEMEHSPLTLETLRAMVLATRGLNAVPVTRVPLAELWMAKRVLDAGSLGVIFPFTNDPALAATAAQACRYPPAGLRGSGAGLANFRWPVDNYYDFADENILCVTVIERVEALASIDEIAATPGIDVLFIGVSDLSFSLGLRGNLDSPLMDEAIGRIEAAAKKHGKWLGRPALTPEDMQRFHARGYQFFQGPTDIDLLRTGARRHLEPAGRFQARVTSSTILY